MYFLFCKVVKGECFYIASNKNIKRFIIPPTCCPPQRNHQPIISRDSYLWRELNYARPNGQNSINHDVVALRSNGVWKESIAILRRNTFYIFFCLLYKHTPQLWQYFAFSNSFVPQLFHKVINT